MNHQQIIFPIDDVLLVLHNPKDPLNELLQQIEELEVSVLCNKYKNKEVTQYFNYLWISRHIISSFSPFVSNIFFWIMNIENLLYNFYMTKFRSVM